jgi:hypothetical protein
MEQNYHHYMSTDYLLEMRSGTNLVSQALEGLRPRYFYF